MGPRPSWGLVWSSKLIPRINMFLWLTMQEKILTINNLWKIGFYMPNKCYLCEKDVEDSYHLFISCIFAREVWALFPNLWRVEWIFPSLVWEL